MSIIKSTGLYGDSYLFEDVESLKTSITEHDARLDILEADDTSSKSRLDLLEDDNIINKTNITTLETYNTSNTTRIVTLETDNTSNKDRLDNLELDNTDNKLRLDDAEGQIFDVVHEPNKYALDFTYGVFHIPYDVLEAYNQLFYSKSLTLQDEFVESETDLKNVIKVIQEILQTHEMKIVHMEFFNTLSDAKAAAQFIWAAGKVVANKFGKKIIKKLFPNWSSLTSLSYDLLVDITDKTLNEVIDELDNLNTIFKYKLDTFAGNTGGIEATNIYFTPSINNIHIGSTISDTVNGITFSDGSTGKTLNNYLDIKDNHPIDRIADKITLKYDTTQFQTGAVNAANAAISYALELKNIMGKVDVKENHPIDKIVDKLTLKYNTTQFKTGAVNAANAAISYALELNDIMDEVKITPKAPIKKTAGTGNTEKQLYLDYDVNEFLISTDQLGNELQLKIKASAGLIKDVTGLGLDLPASSGLEVGATGLKVKSKTDGGISIDANGIYQTYLIDGIDSQTLEKSTANVLSVKLKTNGGISKDANGLYQRFQIDQLDQNTLEKTSTVNDPNKLSVRLSSSSGLEAWSGLKINLYPLTSGLELTSTGLRINTGLSSGLTLAADGISINPTYKTELTTLKTQAQTAATASETAKDAAILARNAAQASQTAASGSAGTAGTEAAAAAGSVTAAAGSAGAAATSAGAAAASATAAAGSAGAAGSSAFAAAGSATAAGLSATAVVLGLSGKADSTHYHSQYLETTAFDGYNTLKDLVWDAKLDIRWNKNEDSSVVYFNTLGNANRRVGIGTSTPSTLLDVNGTINATGYKLNGVTFTGGSNTIAASQRGYYNFVVNSVANLYTYAGQTILSAYDYSCTDRAYDYPNQTFSNHPAYPNYKNVLNYNAGDRILFKMKTNGTTDTITDPVYGIVHVNGFAIWRIPINNAKGRTDWPKDWWYYLANPNEPRRYFNRDDFFYHLYSWYGTNIENYQLPETGLPKVGNFNDNLVITLEAGYVYYFTRRIELPRTLAQSMGLLPVQYTIYEHPITIKVNDPVYLDADSYIPISRPQAIIGAYDTAYVPLTPTPTVPIFGGGGSIIPILPYPIPGLLKPRRSMEVVMGVDVQTSTGYEVVNNGITYTLENGFIFDEINSTISVSTFDGDYNNLINKPILGTIPDITTDHIVENLTATNKFIVNNTYNNNLSVNGDLTIMPLDYNNRMINNVTSSPSATSSGIIGTDRYMCFTYTSDTVANSGQTQYTFTTTEQLNVDILIVAGGGGGANVGGGGAGGLIYVSNQTISANSYNISVGRGGGQAMNGINSLFGTIYTAIGGGGGGRYIAGTSGTNGGNGGSGGGSGGYDDNWSVLPTLPGNGTLNQGNNGGKSGGGAGQVGQPMNGGNGLQYSITGTPTYYAGGGAGIYGTQGGLGGGGKGDSSNGQPNTGGGGGSGSWENNGGNGGSGIVIIRYRLGAPQGSSIKLINGTSTDSNVDYKIWSSNNDFKITSSVSSIDTDRFIMSSAGNVTLNGTMTVPSITVNGLIAIVSATSVSLFKMSYNSTNSIRLYQGAASSTDVRYSFVTVNNNVDSGELLTFRNGNVGIGTGNPAYMLEVAGSILGDGLITVTRYYLSSSGTITTSATSWQVAMKVNGRIWTSAIVWTSDARIKEDIQDINDDSALQMILAIEPKTYKYIDKIEKGNDKVYGFIAQQIREVIPEAVTIQKSYIPNIMLLADYDNHIITLSSQPNYIIKQNDKIKCYDKDNKVVLVEVEEVIDELTFKIKELETEYTDNKIFIYGTEIDDFHTLDKSYIFTLNVCATQELHRKIKSQEARIKELETKMEQILKYISI